MRSVSVSAMQLTHGLCVTCDLGREAGRGMAEARQRQAAAVSHCTKAYRMMHFDLCTPTLANDGALPKCVAPRVNAKGFPLISECIVSI